MGRLQGMWRNHPAKLIAILVVNKFCNTNLHSVLDTKSRKAIFLIGDVFWIPTFVGMDATLLTSKVEGTV